jgi:hypothetical protein
MTVRRAVIALVRAGPGTVAGREVEHAAAAASATHQERLMSFLSFGWVRRQEYREFAYGA